jgi:hypothetical protein
VWSRKARQQRGMMLEIADGPWGSRPSRDQQVTTVQSAFTEPDSTISQGLAKALGRSKRQQSLKACLFSAPEFQHAFQSSGRFIRSLLPIKFSSGLRRLSTARTRTKGCLIGPMPSYLAVRPPPLQMLPSRLTLSTITYNFKVSVTEENRSLMPWKSAQLFLYGPSVMLHYSFLASSQRIDREHVCLAWRTPRPEPFGMLVSSSYKPFHYIKIVVSPFFPVPIIEPNSQNHSSYPDLSESHSSVVCCCSAFWTVHPPTNHDCEAPSSHQTSAFLLTKWNLNSK